MSLRPKLPTIADIEAAARRLDGLVTRTPLLESLELNERLGGRLLIKAECLQRTGSFKLRGAFNRIAQLTKAERKRGVVAFSSGNHAQGVAAAAAQLGVKAIIVMPSDAPAVKIANTRAFGAQVVLYDRVRESREAIADALVAKSGATLVPPFEDFDVVAGQGTCGLEIIEQAEEMGARPDAVVVPASGGGLAAGVGLAMTARAPRTKIFAAEPKGFDDLTRSLKSGRRLSNSPGPASLCDALMSPQPGRIALAILRRLKARGVAVSDAEVMAAMRIGFAPFHLVVEPGGAAALAAVLAGRVPMKDKCVAVVCSGGNVDPVLFATAIKGADSAA